jgi:hypothetical protein
MGSFAFTCCVSGLPIESGDPIRYLLLTKQVPSDERRAGNLDSLWVQRTFPLRGFYNDYGSVDKLQEGPAQDIWIEGLQKDLIETGPGDNTCHDVAVRKNMDFEQILTALWEERVLVHDRMSAEMLKSLDFLRVSEVVVDRVALAGLLARSEEVLHPGIPTVNRVRKAILDAGMPLSDGNHTPGYLVSLYESNRFVRVRWCSYGEDHAEILAKVQTLLSDRFATMITIGTGAYADSAEMSVAPKPLNLKEAYSSYFGDQPEIKREDLRVAQAMIREDVWQALCNLSHKSWNDKVPSDCDGFKSLVREHWEKRLKAKQASSTLPQGELWVLKGEVDTSPVSLILRDKLVYSLGTHFGLMLEKNLTESELTDFLDTVSETLHVQRMLSLLRYQWHPAGPIGPQFGEWPLHRDFTRALGVIAESVVKHQEDEGYESR